MEKSIGDMFTMLYREFVNLSKKQNDMTRELSELREEVALLRSVQNDRRDPCKIFPMNGVAVRRISDKT